MARLSVNVNKIATLRNTRALEIPSVERLARLCLDAGAAGITIHPRPDERHIRGGDVDTLARLLTKFPRAEFNIEGNPFEPKWMDHIRRVRPTQCTLVPDSPDQATSDHGWNIVANISKLAPLIKEMKSLGCRVSLFMDFDSSEWASARSLGADRIELYTEPYARAIALGDNTVVHRFANAAVQAADAGLGVNAGHDLNLNNLPALINAAPQIEEVSIGHALIADALEFGIAETVQRYIAAAEGISRTE